MAGFEVVEKIQIEVAPEQVRAIVRDFKQWVPWSPWLSAEPDCPLEYADDGTSYSWDGKEIGSGTMTITSETDDSIHCNLTFLKPWKSTSKVYFHFSAAGGGTEVTWGMHGSLPVFMFFMKNMMMAWIAADYRRGLRKLKDYSETGTVPSKNEFVGLGEGLVSRYVGIRGRATLDDIGEQMAEHLRRLREWIDGNSVEAKGPPLSIYHKFDMVKNATDYTVAIPVAAIPEVLPDGFVSATLHAKQTYQVRHTGAYRHLGATWSAAMMHQRNKRFRPDKKCPPFEVYVSDPTSVPEGDLITEVHLPARA
jgi:predicted transcriptional regulator YdeE